MRKHSVIKKSMKELSYENLKTMIIHHVLKPNEEIREEALAESLLVSRTPLRAAIQELLTEELLVRKKNGRLMVADITEEKVQEIFHLRALLEGYVVRITTPKIGPQQVHYLQLLNKELSAAFHSQNAKDFVTIGNSFHEYIWRNSELHTTLTMLYTIKSHIERFCYYVSAVDRWNASSIVEHEAILEAFIQQKPELAEKLMQQHIHNSLALLLAKMREHHS